MVIQLHNHSHYSILDGRSRISEIIERTKELGQSAIALTDHGVMYGAIEFYRAAKAAGIKPIIGLEAYLAPASMLRKDARLDGRGTSSHITLLAKNEIGYKNLLKLTSKAHVEGFYYNPRIDLDCLINHKEGIYVLSGCMAGILSSSVLQNDRDESARIIRTFRDIFGPNYAIEVMWHGHDAQESLNKRLLELSDEFGIPAVATCDSHYARPDDARSHDAMLAIQTGSTINDPSRFRIKPYGAYYIQSEEEMRRGFSGREDVLTNSHMIAEQCNLLLDFSKVMLPEFPIPSHHTPISYLKEQVYEGLRWRYGSISDVHKTRVDYELSVIDKTGYALYFLIVQDYVQFARERGVMAVPRGSVAGSLCIYALGICDIDPVKYDIMFERFLHGERKGMPDIDMDFADDSRDSVIEYVTQKYGQHRVAHVGTFQTLGARAAVKDAARVLELPFSISNSFTAMFPETPGVTIAEAEQDDRIRVQIASDKYLEEAVTLAKQIEGLTRGFGTHAAGMLISALDLEEVVPVQLPPEKSSRKNSSTFVTQYDNNNTTAIIESLGLFKFDFLGLVNLSIIRDACALINKRHGVDWYGKSGEKLYSDLPIDYMNPMAQKTYELLSAGDTEAVFQVESPGMRRVLRLVRPSQISDLPAIVALYRPGPMEYIPVYAEAKNSARYIEYLHEDLKPILEETYGVVTYQDQVLLIARNIAGFTWSEVDILRKGMGKKQLDVIEQQKNKFVEQSVSRGYERHIVEQIWEQIAPFAGYGFNRAHAYCYGYVAYITAFLKANYPEEYMCVVLTHESGNKEKIAESINECRKLKIPVTPPSVNFSQENFSLAEIDGRPSIVFGLSAIEGMGSAACRNILSARLGKPFASVVDFLRRIDLRAVNQRPLTGLVNSGAFDEFGHRAQVDSDIRFLLKTIRDEVEKRSSGQMFMFDDNDDISIKMPPPVAPKPKEEILADEFKALGVHVSEHPLDDVRNNLLFYCNRNSSDIQISHEGPVIVGGLVTRTKEHLQKNNKPMCFVTLQDQHGSMDILFFDRHYAVVKNLLVEGNKILVLGEARSRNGEISVLGQEVLVMTAGEDLPIVTIAPPDFEWDLSKQKVSERIMSLWNLHTITVWTPDSTSKMRILSEKGDIDIDVPFAVDELRAVMP